MLATYVIKTIYARISFIYYQTLVVVEVRYVLTSTVHHYLPIVSRAFMYTKCNLCGISQIEPAYDSVFYFENKKRGHFVLTKPKTNRHGV